jgi:HEPN domain-containing protein
MKQITREWVDKAEADFAAALIRRKSRKKHSRDIVCFHLQQCVEKYLKGRMEEAGVAFPKTHDVLKLLDLALTVEPMWIALRPAMSAISVHAVETRYPGRDTTPAEARSLLMATKRIRGVARASLGLN